jgi:ribosomal protein S18 acetylase RimI-like enzyme
MSSPTVHAELLELDAIHAGLLLPSLCALLRDAVHGGASVGFLAPLDDARAGAFWSGVIAALAASERRLWAVLIDGAVVASVQLEACAKENGRQRGDIMKLLVHRQWRRRGFARALMQHAQAEAAGMGLRTLVLDTEVGSAAESVYQSLGWQRVGEIPDYADLPDGTPVATAYYYLTLKALA